MKPIYYLSGKISAPTREEELANMEVFNQVEAELVARGFDVFNPAKLEVTGGTWEYYLSRDLLWIYENKPIIYLISNDWQESRGARLEVEWAKMLGLQIVSPL